MPTLSLSPSTTSPVTRETKLLIPSEPATTATCGQIADLAAPGIPEAPNDGKQYARKDGAWVEIATSSSTAFAPSVSISSESTPMAASSAGAYNRFTYAGPSIATIQSDASTPEMPAAAEIHMRAVGGQLTVSPASGVTVTPQSGGSLVVPVNGTVTVKRVGPNAWEMFGLTVAP